MSELLNSFIQEIFPQCRVNLKLVKPYLHTRTFPKGEFLFQEGDICDFLGLTIEGCLRTFLLHEGKELTLFFHPEHHTFGDYESFRRQLPAHFSCQAIENSEVLVLNQQAIDKIEADTDGQKLLRLVVENFAFQLRDRLFSLYRDSPEQRYLNLLNNQPQLLQRIPQYYLASHLGVEPESLSRLKKRVQLKGIS